jgi:hypothetical protein
LTWGVETKPLAYSRLQLKHYYREISYSWSRRPMKDRRSTAILIMLFANVAYRIMHTLSSTQSESARFYSVFVLDNIYSPHCKVNLHSNPVRIVSYQSFKKSSPLFPLVTTLYHVIKTHRMVGKNTENLTVRSLTLVTVDNEA